MRNLDARAVSDRLNNLSHGARMHLLFHVIGMLCGFAPLVARAQEPATQPNVPPAAQRIQRLTDLAGIIEGQNPPQTRRITAREMLLLPWPERTPRVVAILNGSNAAARIAVAAALTETPDALDRDYVEPLLAMLGDADSAVRDAAASALAAYPDEVVTDRLRRLVQDHAQPRTARLAGIAALGLMTEREAIAGLMRTLDDPDPEIRRAALRALTEAMAVDFDVVEAARAWWDESRSLSAEAWQQRQIERLVRKDRELRRQLEAMQARLVKVYEESFQRATEPERVAALAAYLSDAETTIRLLGLRLAQVHLTEGKTLPSELCDRIRELLNAPDSPTRAAAIRTLASLRDPGDAERFLKMLPSAGAREVRLALLNGLGHVGTAEALDVLCAVLEHGDEAERSEAVSAIGRLAERGLLKNSGGVRAAEALQREFERALPAQVALRERLLRAMGNFADPRFAAAYAAGLERNEPVSIRQAAVRGLAALKGAGAADSLTIALSDPDAGVRKTAVEAFAALALPANETHVMALWDRAVSPQETDDTVRQIARRSAIELLTRAPTEVLERWLTRLPRKGNSEAQRTLETLQRLVRAVQEGEAADRRRLGLLRAAIAATYAQMQQVSEALLAYSEALPDLYAAQAANAARNTAADFVRYALTHRRYDGSMAAALASYVEPADIPVLWQAVVSVIEPRIAAPTLDHAAGMIAAVADNPPGEWPDGAEQTIARWRAAMERLRQEQTTGTAPTATQALHRRAEAPLPPAKAPD